MSWKYNQQTETIFDDEDGQNIASLCDNATAEQGEEIVIVEVKTREGDYFEEPWEAVSTKKIRNLVEAADAWLIRKKIDLETRFDVISIIFSDDVNYELKHFPGAFIPPVN